MFRSRNEWFAHELQNHRREWICDSCPNPFNSRLSFEKHLTSVHGSKATGSELEALILQSEEPIDKVPASACMLCDELESSLLGSGQDAKRAFLNNGTAVEPYVTLGQFRRHLGQHMEQLALFALPMHEEEGMDDDSAAGSGSDNEEEPRTDVLEAIEQLQARSSATTSDANGDSPFIDEAELETLNEKLSYQKDILSSWKSLWSMSPLSPALLDVAEAVESIMSTINYTLAEVELAWQSAFNLETPNHNDRVKFKKLVLSFTASINALYDISRPFDPTHMARPSHIPGNAVLMDGNLRDVARDVTDKPLTPDTEEVEEPVEGVTARVTIVEEKETKAPLTEAEIQTEKDMDKDVATVAAAATTVRATERASSNEAQRSATSSDSLITVDPIPHISQESSVVKQESINRANVSPEQQQEARNMSPDKSTTVGVRSDETRWVGDDIKFRTPPGQPATHNFDQAPGSDASPEISDGGKIDATPWSSRQRRKRKSTRKYVSPGINMLSDTEVDDPEPAPVEESDWVFESREKRSEAKYSADVDNTGFGHVGKAQTAIRESMLNPDIHAPTMDEAERRNELIILKTVAACGELSLYWIGAKIQILITPSVLYSKKDSVYSRTK